MTEDAREMTWMSLRIALVVLVASGLFYAASLIQT